MTQESELKIRDVYNHISAMEPLFPSRSKEIDELAVELIRKSAALAECVHPITRTAIVEVVRSMNSYYSNLIEGHATHPLDIEKALKKDYSIDPSKRALQLESKAHIEVQQLIEARLKEDPELSICSSNFICWIHKEFYDRLPPEFCTVETESGGKDTVYPGKLRTGEVIVYHHIPPSWKSLPSFLSRFASVYEPASLDPLTRIIAAAASHHRLVWIHPFLDGNGRVTRLFTHAYLIKTKTDGHGLWMVSRGFARFHDEYMRALRGADANRKNAVDGRGNLSDKGLADFCTFFLSTALDQIKFMSSLLDLDSVHGRIVGFAEYWARQQRDYIRSISANIAHLLSDLFLRGELSRGETTAILSIPERTAREVIKLLLEEKLITSFGPRESLRLGFPANTIGFYFPKLYPDNVELDLQWGKSKL